MIQTSKTSEEDPAISLLHSIFYTSNICLAPWTLHPLNPLTSQANFNFESRFNDNF